jgi:glycosyltransferase involved in cell wall biosynthesis
MILGIDASRAATGQRTGTEGYAYHLIRTIIPLARERGHRLRLYFNTPPTGGLFPENESVESVVIPRGRMWTHTRLRQELATRPPDIFYTPAHVIPLGYRGPSAATIHDLGYEYFPESHPRRQLAYLRWSTRHNARSARVIIADSNATRDDLIRLYHIDSAKIAVVYPGIDAELRRTEDVNQIETACVRQGIRRPYLLYLGTLQPRKNLVRLVEAYAASRLHEQEVMLVLAGKSGWLAQKILDGIDRQPPAVRDRVRVTGYIGETEKNLLLSGATALVFPSLYEGFGFPVLEAQACGTPVICANTSSLPEVAGDAAWLVDPLDVAGLAEAMVSITENRGLREELFDRGYRNLDRFQWESTAVRVLDLLENVGQHT